MSRFSCVQCNERSGLVEGVRDVKDHTFDVLIGTLGLASYFNLALSLRNRSISNHRLSSFFFFVVVFQLN